MLLNQLALLLNVISTWYMVGLIWFVQLVHYPQFAQVGLDGWGAYHRRHTRLTTWAVGPAMLVELASAVALVWRPPADLSAATWVGLALVAAVWVSTAAVQVPCHNRLASGFDAAVCRRLVATNWLRTALWSARGALTVYLLARTLAP